MPRNCCVPGCKSNYYADSPLVTIFLFPKDKLSREKWANSINRKNFIPTKDSAVCINHFASDIIITEDQLPCGDGSFVTVPRKKIKLQKDAFPTIFENQPSYLSKQLTPKRKDPSELIKKVISHDNQQFEEWNERDNISGFEEFGNQVLNRSVNPFILVKQDIRIMTDVKGKDSLMKKLLSTAPNMSVMPSVPIPAFPSTLIDYSTNVPSPLSDSSEDNSTKLSSFLRQLARQSGRELNIVLMDHAYSKPGNWHSENTYAKPTKTLFVLNVSPPTVPRLGNEEEEVDIEGVPETPVPPYDVGSVSLSMHECDNYINSVKPGDRGDDWEEQVNRTGWTNSQHRMFSKVVRALHLDRLARLSCSGSWNEPVQRRIIVDKTARRVRHLLSCYSWEPRLMQWLHSTLLDCLSPQYLAIYLDVLQSMRAKAPVLVDRMLAAVPISNRPGLSGLESMNLIVKQPWDPVATSLNEHKPRKLPGNPILVMVPSTPYSGALQPPRLKQWESYFSALGMVVTVMVKTGPETGKMTLTSCLDQMMCATRVKVAQLRAEYPGRYIILVGWNAGACIACQVALVEQVSAVVCLGFPIFTVEGKRGDPNDTLLDLRAPVFFVIGQNASTARQEDVEDMRERMRIETGLVVVGSADDQLRVGKSKKQMEGVTQSMIDRCILDEVGDFLGSILMLPRPHPLRSLSNHAPNGSGIACDIPNSVITKGETKRKTTGSEPSSPVTKRSRPGTPLHGLTPAAVTTAASPVAAQSPTNKSTLSTLPTLVSVAGPKARQKARIAAQKLQSNTGMIAASQPSGSTGDQVNNTSNGITVNIGSLGSLTPIGPIRLGQTATTLSSASSSPSLSEVSTDHSHITQRGRGTSLTIQGNLISSGASNKSGGFVEKACSVKGGLHLQSKQLRGTAKSTESGTLTSLSSLLQGGQGTRLMVSSASSLLLTPSTLTTAAGGQQLKVLGSEENLQGLTFSNTTPTVPSTRMRTSTGRMLDLSKLTVLTSTSGGTGKNLLGTTSGGNVVMLTESPRGTRPGSGGPLLVPVSTVASPFTILPLTNKASRPATERGPGQRSYTVIPKITVPSLKLSQSTAQQMTGTKLSYTVPSTLLRGQNPITISQSSEEPIEVVTESNKTAETKDYDEDTLTPDKILELPIIFAKDGDDSLFLDNKLESDILEPPTVLPISSCSSGDGSSSTLTLGDTISFPLEDSESDIPKSGSSARAVPNVFIIRSKNSKEKIQGGNNKRIVQKTHRFLRAIDKIPSQNQSNVKHGTGIKYTKIILTNRNSSLKVGELEPGCGNGVSVKKDQLQSIDTEPLNEIRTSSPLISESLNVEDIDDSAV